MNSEAYHQYEKSHTNLDTAITRIHKSNGIAYQLGTSTNDQVKADENNGTCREVIMQNLNLIKPFHSYIKKAIVALQTSLLNLKGLLYMCKLSLLILIKHEVRNTKLQNVLKIYDAGKTPGCNEMIYKKT